MCEEAAKCYPRPTLGAGLGRLGPEPALPRQGPFRITPICNEFTVLRYRALQGANMRKLREQIDVVLITAGLLALGWAFYGLFS